MNKWRNKQTIAQTSKKRPADWQLGRYRPRSASTSKTGTLHRPSLLILSQSSRIYRVSMDGKYATLSSVYELRGRRRLAKAIWGAGGSESPTRSSPDLCPEEEHHCEKRSSRTHSISACVSEVTKCALQILCSGSDAVLEGTKCNGYNVHPKKTTELAAPSLPPLPPPPPKPPETKGKQNRINKNRPTTSVLYCSRIRLRSFSHIIQAVESNEKDVSMISWNHMVH